MTTTEVESVTRELTEWFEATFADIESMASGYSELLERDNSPDDAVVRISGDSRKGIQERALHVLRAHPIVDGAGAIFAREKIGSTKGVIEWWVRDDDGRMARYSFGVDPAEDRFYDYERLEWFNAFVQRTRWITGPYIDYLGIEEYIVTLTVPLRVHDVLAGVVGVDIRMSDLETALMPILRRVSGNVALLNAHSSVLVGNSGRYVSGDHVAPTPDGFETTDLRLSALGLRLLHPAEH